MVFRSIVRSDLVGLFGGNVSGSGAAWIFKKKRLHRAGEAAVACFVRFPSADHGSLPVTWYTAMQPFASKPPPVVQIAGSDCPVKAVLAIGT